MLSEEVIAEPAVSEGTIQAGLGITIVLHGFGIWGLFNVSGNRAGGQVRIAELLEIRSRVAWNSLLRIYNKGINMSWHVHFRTLGLGPCSRWTEGRGQSGSKLCSGLCDGHGRG